jgi:hypothetical protein
MSRFKSQVDSDAFLYTAYWIRGVELTQRALFESFSSSEVLGVSCATTSPAGSPPAVMFGLRSTALEYNISFKRLTSSLHGNK